MIRHLRQPAATEEPGLEPARLEELRRPSAEVESEVLRVVLERARAGSRPRERTDDHIVALAIEGGGMRGAVSAGMCVVLEAAGLTRAFDRIYGVSAGAVNGAATAAGQAALSATWYQDAARRSVINHLRPLLRRPVVDLDALFDDVIAAHKPLSFDRLLRGPQFYALAVSLKTMSLRVLTDFQDMPELMQAIRASSSLPRLGGAPAVFRGEPMTDGGVLEPIPFRTALRAGATHVLVLRSRPAGYRIPRLLAIGETMALRDHPELAERVGERRIAYDRDAARLEQWPAEAGDGAQLWQVAVAGDTPLIRRLERNPERVVDALRVGARTMAAEVLSGSFDLCWQPIVYRASRLRLAPSVEEAT